MNRKIWQAVLFGTTLVSLTACTQLSESEPISQKTTDTVPAETTSNQLSNDYYRALIVDGKYQTSQNRGVSLNLNSSINMKDFESELLAISKNVFSTNEYFFQEGQIITSDTATEWLGRKSEDNPNGLNPEGNGETEPDKRIPIYLSQILEQNYMIQTEKGFELGGIAIGLAMNATDYYSVKNEQELINNYEQELNQETVIENAKKYGNEIVSRLRSVEGLGDIPIVVGIFVQSEQDSLAGGLYTHEGLSSSGNKIEEWVERNDKKVLFPNSVESEDASHFANFKNEIQEFFPNLSGVTGVGRYSNSQLQSLEINIMTQFYGVTEMIAFTQQVTDAATQYLPQQAAIQIKIQSIDGIEAFLSRNQGSQTFNFHIFE